MRSDAPPGFVACSQGECAGWLRADLAALPAAVWWEAGQPFPGAKGRGEVALLDLDGVRGVARRYRRGGALRHVLPDRFASPRRVQRELAVLAALRARGVLVVEPLAALWRGAAPLFELRLVTTWIEGAAPLPDFVAAHPDLRRAAVRRAGGVVAAAFAAGLVHTDLHPDNLVARLEPGGALTVALLDLDRAQVVARLTPGQHDAMLVRMARYLVRHARSLRVAASLPDRLRFLAGMGHTRAERRSLVARLVPQLEAQVRRHRLAWWIQG
ncbi:MAG: phosphotransferase [Planctomycetes bacterium]|nr:phosphotransferase [Planctomycetota bacterium]